MLAAALDDLDDVGALGGGAVDAVRRRRALRAYAALGRGDVLPSTWRHDYTALTFANLLWSSGRIPVPELPPFDTPREPQPGADDVPALALENAGGIVHIASTYLQPRIVRVAPHVTLAALADARRTDRAAVETIHQRVVPFDADRFTALATAFQNCGAYVEVAAHADVAAPLQLLWTGGPHAAGVFPHTVVRVGAGARATIIERHIGEAESFVCGIVELDVGPGARVEYVVVQQADEGARVIMHRGARVGAGAHVGWHVADLGAALVRSTSAVRLTGVRAAAAIDAFAFANVFVNADLRVNVVHAAPATRGCVTVRRAASERGTGHFAANVRVAAQAERAEVALHDEGLLLAPTAVLGARPNLQVEADHVSAVVTGAVGSIDGDAVFYIQSRGIPRETAEHMMALAFFEPAILGFPGEALRDEVRTALEERLDRVPETFVT